MIHATAGAEVSATATASAAQSDPASQLKAIVHFEAFGL